MNREEVEREIANLIPQRDLAKLFKVSIRTVIAWNRVGVNGMRLPKVKIGRHAYYRPDDVQRFQQWVCGGIGRA